MSLRSSSSQHSSEHEQAQSKIPREMDERSAINPAPTIKSKGYYWTNLAGVSLGVLCLVAGYSVLFFIQSSLHTKGGLGSMALAVDYVAQLVSCFFLPPLLMRSIGCKWSLVLSGVASAIFIAANLIGTFATLLPAAVLLGMGYATMWATMNTVVSDLATGYAKVTGRPIATTMSQFFSIFFTFMTSASIWANIISSQIISPQDVLADDKSSASHRACGAQYCDMDDPNSDKNTFFNITTPMEVPRSELTNLVIAGVSIVGLGIIVLLALLHTYQPEERDYAQSSIASLLASIKLHRDPNLLLLINVTINSGLTFSFNTADFTKAFVTCSIGIHNVGWVVSSFGIATSVGTAILVFVAPLVPRVSLFLGAVVLNIADLVLMLCWTPDPQTPYVFFVISAIWGLTFAVWMSQLCALYGDVFPNNHQEAYSSQRMWDCVGFVIGFTWSHYVCMAIKIYIIIGSLITGTIGYIVVERRLARCHKFTLRRMSIPLTD